jgi:hypothetical protein
MESDACQDSLADQMESVLQTFKTRWDLLNDCMKQPSRTLEHFSRAIDIQPGYAASYWTRGQV